MKRLYVVTIETQLVVYAHSKEEAKQIANTYKDDNEIDSNMEIEPVTKMTDIPEGWKLPNIYPYELTMELGEEPLTIKDIIEKMK